MQVRDIKPLLFQKMIDITFKVKNSEAINENINDLNYTMKINNVNSFTVLVHYYNVLNVYIGTQNFEYDINKVDSNNEYYKSIFQHFLKTNQATGIDIDNIKYNIPLEIQGGAPRKNKEKPIILSSDIKTGELKELMSNTPIVSQTDLEKFYNTKTKGGKKSKKNKKSRKGRKNKKGKKSKSQKVKK